MKYLILLCVLMSGCATTTRYHIQPGQYIVPDSADGFTVYIPNNQKFVIENQNDFYFIEPLIIY